MPDNSLAAEFIHSRLYSQDVKMCGNNKNLIEINVLMDGEWLGSVEQKVDKILLAWRAAPPEAYVTSSSRPECGGKTVMMAHGRHRTFPCGK